MAVNDTFNILIRRNQLVREYLPDEGLKTQGQAESPTVSRGENDVLVFSYWMFKKL